MPISNARLVAFFRAFATLCGAGITVPRALDVTIEQTSKEQTSNTRLRESLRSVKSGIESGLSLAAALSRHPKEFSPHIIAAISAGELGGSLDRVLSRLAKTLEQERALRKRVGAALTYPAIVGVAAIALVLFLLTSIVPMFRSMYEQLHAPLPHITLLLIGVGEFLRSPQAGIAAAAVCAGGAAAIAQARSSRTGSRAIDAIRLRIPLLRTIARKSSLARAARIFGTLLESGVGVVAALNAVADAAGSIIFAQTLRDAAVAVSHGALVSEALGRSEFVEPIFKQFVRAGEETGSLDRMLLHAADYYEIETEAMLTSLGAAIEPLLMMALGGCIAFILASVFIPLYSLIGALK